MLPVKNRSKIQQVFLYELLKKLHIPANLGTKNPAEVIPKEHMEYKRMNKLMDK